MHQKFTVIDLHKPPARVYPGSYNSSTPADLKNGENLVIVRDRRIAVSYMIEALSLFDHYSFRVAQKTAAAKGQKLHLSRPPRAPGENPWGTTTTRSRTRSRIACCFPDGARARCYSRADRPGAPHLECRFHVRHRRRKLFGHRLAWSGSSFSKKPVSYPQHCFAVVQVDKGREDCR